MAHKAAIFLSSLLVMTFAQCKNDDQNTGVNASKIDTHSHIYPDFYRAAVIAAGWVPGPDGNAAPPNWTLQAHLNFMQQNNVEKSYVSCSSPGTFLMPNNTAAGVALTQQFNNFSADLKRNYPDKFGFFASLPLPSIPDALTEIDRALDELNADGFVMLSNAFGLYGGDPKLAPVYQKLNKRKAVIFVHPTNPCPINTPVDAPTLEFIFDTTRNLADLIVTGTAAAYSEVKWIIPHCGAALPSVIDRFLRIGSILGAKPGSDRPSVPYTLANATALLQKQFWFDIAGCSMQHQIYDMRRIVGADKFTYGSDAPFTAFPAALGLAGEIAATLPTLFNDTEIEMIYNGNARKLLGKK